MTSIPLQQGQAFGLLQLRTPRRHEVCPANAEDRLLKLRSSRTHVAVCSASSANAQKGALPIGWPKRRAMRGGSTDLRRFEAKAKLDNESEGKEEEGKGSKIEEKLGLVKQIEIELGRQFGTALWYGVLLVFLAVFGGGYVFLIFNYADFSDIPILRGPQGTHAL